MEPWSYLHKAEALLEKFNNAVSRSEIHPFTVLDSEEAEDSDDGEFWWIFYINTKPIKTVGFNWLWQDRPHGAKCPTDDRLRVIFCTDTKPTKLLGFVLIQNPTADSGTLTKLDAYRL